MSKTQPPAPLGADENGAPLGADENGAPLGAYEHGAPLGADENGAPPAAAALPGPQTTRGAAAPPRPGEAPMAGAPRSEAFMSEAPSSEASRPEDRDGPEDEARLLQEILAACRPEPELIPPTPEPGPDQPDLALRRSLPPDPEPLARILAREEDLALANPSAAHPFRPNEWREKWLADPQDAAFYVTDAQGRDVGFFALRQGAGPEIRHLAYLCLEPARRGGAGGRMTQLVECAARDLGARIVTLKVELDNAPALRAYRAAGYEQLSSRRGMATMRLDLEPAA